MKLVGNILIRHGVDLRETPHQLAVGSLHSSRFSLGQLAAAGVEQFGRSCQNTA
ncbi:MAG: hypothetical protein IID45_12085 [Planctomycetes bacterium]|nr:hypothetical protein [Planctomycetota bacterium]